MKGILFDDDIRIQLRKLPDGRLTGFVIGEVTYQNQCAILLANPGEFKYNPKTGVGIESFLDEESPESMLREIRTQLATEGMKVQKIGFSENGNLEIEAGYNK